MKLHGIPVVIDPTMKEGEIHFGATTWVRHDTYKATLVCRNRFKTALRALLYGHVEAVWEVPATKKDKRFHLKGTRI